MKKLALFLSFLLITHTILPIISNSNHGEFEEYVGKLESFKASDKINDQQKPLIIKLHKTLCNMLEQYKLQLELQKLEDKEQEEVEYREALELENRKLTEKLLEKNKELEEVVVKSSKKDVVTGKEEKEPVSTGWFNWWPW